MATRAEMLAEAYRRDLLTPEKKTLYEEAMRRGLVGKENQPIKQSSPQEHPPPQREDFASRVGDALEKRLETSKEIIGRRDIRNPYEAQAGAMLVGGQAAGAVGDIIGEGMVSAYKTLVPEETQTSVKEGLKKALSTPMGQAFLKAAQKGGSAYSEFSNSYPDAAKALEGMANLAGLSVGGKGASLAGKETRAITRDIGKLMTNAEQMERQISYTVRNAYERGIRPSVSGKGTFSRQGKAAVKAQDAVEEIISRKGSLALTDDAGERVVGELPQNIRQFSEAIEQTKRGIYQEYNTMAKEAGEQGITFDAAPITRKLTDISRDLKHSPQIRKYAEDLIDEIKELHGQAPEVIESRIAELNSSLQGFYDGRIGKAKAQVDASVAELMREELDAGITGAMGPGYQNLKNRYGALKSIEKEVNHRLTVSSRQNKKGLIDFTNIFTDAEIVTGAARMMAGDPAGAKSVLWGAAAKVSKGRIKNANDPNNIIRKMFQDTEALMGKRGGRPPESYLGKKLSR